MIDPITAMSVAVNAFGTIKRMVSAGKEVEDTLSQIGRFYGAVSDLSEAKRQADNPPLFKKIISSKSVNEEAMNTYARNKRTQQMERELRELLMYTYGKEGYNELVQLRRSIAAQREKTIYLQERKRKALFWNSIQITGIAILGYAAYFVFALILGAMNGNG
jgi:methionine aminopeptidase